ncbi:hypothetical protein PG996_009991 [Apiospora saccharicola]|uniref:Uncharacterized protein n=1 Tax=Apiospora saccharicola TaxID=335842 RepID=A0ABR1UMC1_9PEZI
MAHPRAGAAPRHTLYGVPAPRVQASASRMTNLYHKLGQLDPDRTFPLDLVHILVKAAFRDPAIALDLDNAIQRQYLLAPGGLQPAQMGPPIPGAPVQPPNSSGVPSPPILSPDTPTPPAPTAAPPAPAPRPSSNAPSIPASRVPAATGQKRPAYGMPSVPLPPPRRIRTEAPMPLTGPGSASQPFIIPEDPPTPPRASPRRPVPPPRESEVRQPNYRNLEAFLKTLEAFDRDAPPREKQAKYDKLLKQTDRDLGWYGKYDRCSEWKEEELAVAACDHIGVRLGNLAKAMGQHRSYANRLHVLTVMREILMSCLKTSGCEVGSQVRNFGMDYDGSFVSAVQAMTPGQRRKVRAEGGGAWVDRFCVVTREARSYWTYGRLCDALVLLDPRRARRVKPWGDHIG